MKKKVMRKCTDRKCQAAAVVRCFFFREVAPVQRKESYKGYECRSGALRYTSGSF